ncbi:MAG: hypothetical protein K8H88_33935 [Sandaracinaceae bacterium]|nr:hypothetical protein [Sandaracinaceae bacterium]
MADVSSLALSTLGRVVDALGGHTFQISPEVRHRRVHRLYENAKRDQWNASERLQYGDRLEAEGLSPEERTAICRVFSQLYYGERGAQVISSQLCTMVQDNEAAKFLSTQAMDEARHVEVFEKMLLGIEQVYPMNPFLNALLTDMMRTRSLEEKLIGMNLLVEGLALTIFKFTVKLFDADPRYHNAVGRAVYDSIQLILRDESRHVGFGMVYLPHLLQGLSRRRVREIQARQLAWMGLLFASVRYHKRDSERVGIPYLDILADILAEHQARVAEMGVEAIVTGEQLSKLIPSIDRAIDRVTGYERAA